MIKRDLLELKVEEFNLTRSQNVLKEIFTLVREAKNGSKEARVVRVQTAECTVKRKFWVFYI